MGPQCVPPCRACCPQNAAMTAKKLRNDHEELTEEATGPSASPRVPSPWLPLFLGWLNNESREGAIHHVSSQRRAHVPGHSENVLAAV
jgi:hypothetical protein